MKFEALKYLQISELSIWLDVLSSLLVQLRSVNVISELKEENLHLVGEKPVLLLMSVSEVWHGLWVRSPRVQPCEQRICHLLTGLEVELLKVNLGKLEEQYVDHRAATLYRSACLGGCLKTRLGEFHVLKVVILDEPEPRPNEGLLLLDFQGLLV